MKKWSLIVFTILAQSAAGAFVILIGHKALMGAASVVLPDMQVLAATTMIMIAALLVSLTHLGAPQNAHRSAANFWSSWLSREIVFGLLFAGCAVLTLILSWRGEMFLLRVVISWLGALFAFGLVFSMSQVYMVRTVRAWNTVLTLFGFFLTALLLGALLNAIPARRVNEMMVSGMLFLIAAGLVVFVLWVLRIAAKFRQYDLAWAVVFRVVLSLIGAGLLVAILFREGNGIDLVSSAFAVLLAGEVIGRWLFYRAQEVTEWEN